MHLSPKNSTIGIVGAGTMGAGIALSCLYAGYKVVLQDSFPNAIENAKTYINKFLTKKEMKERINAITFSADLNSIADADLIIEAVIEDLGIKKKLFSQLENICKPATPLTTNTSTLSVTSIASGLADQTRFAGIHFFNPAPVLPLIEIIKTSSSDQSMIKGLEEFAISLGKTPVIVEDTPGFIVNRVARPFYGEALRLLGEGVTSFDAIDEIVTKGAHFRMGPFELMDLIGIDINTTAMISMYEQTFHEARYKPHWIQIQKMEAGDLGRKTGKGFYTYPRTEPAESQSKFSMDPQSTKVLISSGSFTPNLFSDIRKKGFDVQIESASVSSPDLIIVSAGRNEGLENLIRHFDAEYGAETPVLSQACDVTLAEIASWMKHPQRLVGFDGLFLTSGNCAVLTQNHQTEESTKKFAENFFVALGKSVHWVDDSPGLILPRIILLLINESSFAQLEGVSTPENIDKAMQLGVNYPKGPLSWGSEIGWDKVLAVLEHLYHEYGEERYRPSRLIRRWAWESKKSTQ